VRITIIALAMAALSITTDSGNEKVDKDTQKALDQLHGKFKVAKAETDIGNQAPGGMVFEFFKHDQTFAITKDGKSMNGRFKIDATKTPGSIRISMEKREDEIGIFKVEKDSLVICIGKKADIPTTFSVPKGKNYALLHLERSK
jgi:uncharacterized protein (TIGR03067 family)